MDRVFNVSLMMMALVVGGCVKKEAHKDEGATSHTSHHAHVAPHGGAAVVLGEEFCHLEFVLDAPEGRLQAYVLDGELENFIRVAQPALELSVNAGGELRTLVLNAAASSATGETVGDTALFEAQADWLRSTKTFDAVLKKITVRGVRFENVAFNFPQGNERASAHKNKHEGKPSK